MANSIIGRIHPGASVEGADGHLGHVARVEPEALEVLDKATNRRLFVPVALVHEVRADGTVELSASRAELERLVRPTTPDTGPASEERVDTLELREEQLVPRKELEEVGRVRIRKAVEDVPRRLELDAYYEEAEIEHVPIGRVVKEREAAREEDGVHIVPIYEEQLVVVKRLVLKEEIRIRHQGVTEKRLFEETVRRERLVIEDPDRTGRVREHYATEQPEGERVAGDSVRGEEEESPEERSLLEKLGRKVLD
jgi:uncharacterized protein (TIGR02271 family)